VTFPLDDIFPGVGDPAAKHPATFGPRMDLGGGVDCAGCIWHTTEYSTGLVGFSRATAIRCATDQANGQPGSYNFIIYDKNSTGAKGGVLLTVPFREGSGGINPASAAWAPERFPWLKTMLGVKAYSDPTLSHVQIAFSGDTADIAAGRMPDNMLQTAADLATWIQKQPWGKDDLVFSGHLHWQTNRSDPTAALLDRIIARMATVPAPTPPPDYKALYLQEVVKTTDLSKKLSSARTRITTVKTKVAANAADIAND
jgi:hypothetical protein